VRISAHTEAGDVDIVLSDAAKRPIEISNFRELATEFIIAALAPGDYTISLIAQSSVNAYELRLTSFREISVPVLMTLQKLSDEQRQQLVEMLATAGYTPAGNAAIGVGGETARALLAAQEGAARDVGPGGVGRVITKQMTDR
jgi:hypothetical protein